MTGSRRNGSSSRSPRPRRRNPAAAALADPLYKKRVVRDRTKDNPRKGRAKDQVDKEIDDDV